MEEMPFVFVIVITGMVLTYKLLSQIITRAKGPRPSRRKTPYEPVPAMASGLSAEEVDELIVRAQEMQRRIVTLEEIVAAERAQRSEA